MTKLKPTNYFSTSQALDASMNSDNIHLASGLVKKSYIAQGEQALNSRRNVIKALLSNRSLPKTGWDDAQIEYLLSELSLMDSNNFIDGVGVGEREARIYSGMVARRSFRFCHGIGRSGDIAETQPKAAGSSLLNKICHILALDALKCAGLKNCTTALVVPMATGMSIALCIMALRRRRPSTATKVLWTRVDQKSCLKAIVTAGFTPIPIHNILHEDAVICDMVGLKDAIELHGADNILCVISTTSCFAPREPDPVDQVAKLCASAGIPHIVNNAYGLQCKIITACLNKAMACGRVDVIVQSTDKNFMVPVGGAIICGADTDFIDAIAKTYPGRASISPILDLTITLLSMGKEGYEKILRERDDLLPYFRETLDKVAAEHELRVLQSPGNTISFAIGATTDRNREVVQRAGSMLFTRLVSGCRVLVPNGEVKEVAGLSFQDYGTSCDGYPNAYLTAACAIGMRKEEVDEFAARLRKVLKEAAKKIDASKQTSSGDTPAPSVADDIAEISSPAV